MPALFVFLFKVNMALLLFCAGYYLVLRQLTFYTLNRVYLVTAIIFATIYPKVDLSGFAQQHENLAKPVQNVVLIWQGPAQQLAAHPNYWQWAEIIFWTGAALLTLKLLVQLFSLFGLYRRSKPAKLNNHRVRIMATDAAPFSFWQSIYVNPANHSPADLEAILLHEQVHVNDWHTIDILLAELSSIFYWFNPGIWLMKKAVRENVEFITDRKILNNGFDCKTYQYSLVNVSFNNTTPAIVNHFNISTIKKRIMMMNAKRSSKVKLTRYAFIVPAVVALLLVFTLSKASVSKPIAIKFANSIKPVTNVFKHAAAAVISNTRAVINGAKKDTVIKQVNFTATTNTNGKGKADSLFYSVSSAKGDTDKKPIVLFRSSEGNSLDSMNLVLNGKKISSAEFKNIDPAKISAINICDQATINNLKGMPGNLAFDNNRKVIFIATSDSEAGKKLMAQLGTRRQLSDVRINGSHSDELTTLSGLQALGTAHAIILRGSKATRLTGLTGKPNIVTVRALSGRKLNVNDTVTVTTLASVNTIAPANVLALKADPIVKVFTTSPGKVYKFNSIVNYSTNDVATVEAIDRVTGAIVVPVTMSADKLYIIDGKQASEKEMKKLSAYDIERINLTRDDSMVAKYGDKAKNGVIYIYTKKRNK